MTTTLDMGARYSVAGYEGIAFWLDGYPQRWEPYTCLMEDPETGEEWEEPTDEGEWVDDLDCGLVLAVMVGDDYRHKVPIDDLTVVAREDYCGECGQIGCRHDGYPRD